MKVVVVGATGVLGKAITTLLSENGHEIVRASRSTQPSLDIYDSASVGAFYEAIGEVDAIIFAAGSVSFGSLPALSDEQLRLDIDGKLLGQVTCVRKGLSVLRPGGVFVLTGGTLAYTPAPGTSTMAMINAGLEGFVRAAALDLQDRRRIVIVHPPAARETAALMGMDETPWPRAATIAEAYLATLEGEVTGQPVFVDGYDPS